VPPAEITVQHNAYLDPVISGNTEGLFNRYVGNVILDRESGYNLEIARDMQRNQLNQGIDFALVCDVKTHLIGEYVRTRPLADATVEDVTGVGVRYYPKMRMVLESLNILPERAGCDTIYSFTLTELDKLTP